ncbi:AMP-binding protein [Phytohabitans suffuscus]
MSQPTTTHTPEDWRRVVGPEDAAHFREQGWWRDTTGLDELLRAVQRHPHKAAVVCYRKGDPLPTVITYGQLGTMVDRFAGAFLKLGVEPGDVVTIQLPNTWEFPALVFGAMRAGAIPNPVPHIYRERELSFMLRHARSKVYVVQSRFKGYSYRDLGLRLKPSLPHLRHLVTIGGPAGGDAVDFTDFFVSPLHEHDDGLAQELDARRPGPDDPAFLMFTSGTTGQPKAALHSHNTAWSAGRPLPEALRLAADDVCFMASTVGHLTGFFWGTYLPLSTGQKVVYQDEWDPRGLVDIIDREGITWTLSATPFAMDMIEAQKAQPRPLSSFRAFACGGAPIPPSAAVAMQEHLGVDLVSLWGMTEVGICSIHQLGSSLSTLAASDGKQVPYMGLRIVDDDLQPVPDGTEGRLQARGPSIILGYRDQPELTRDAQTPDGWFETGDLGRRMPDGGIRITGRSKDIIIRGGQNVPVVEIENLLAQHGKVRDVAVVAYPDERLGERGCAVVVPEGTPPTLRELTAHLEAAGMAKQFWPERLEIREAMPRTPSGKIQKYVLRREVAPA